MSTDVRDNKEQERFELVEQGHTAFAGYAREQGKLYILHVEAPTELRGSGAAGRLMEGVLEHAAAAGETVKPICSYAAAWMKKRGCDV